MIEKILDRLEEEKEHAYADFEDYVNDRVTYLDFENDDFFYRGLERAKEIVRRVAREYGNDTNVLSNGWIPCSERLPESNQRVLVFDVLDGSITIEQLDEDESFIPPVIAWMPLPSSPYQKGE